VADPINNPSVVQDHVKSLIGATKAQVSDISLRIQLALHHMQLAEDVLDPEKTKVFDREHSETVALPDPAPTTVNPALAAPYGKPKPGHRKLRQAPTNKKSWNKKNWTEPNTESYKTGTAAAAAIRRIGAVKMDTRELMKAMNSRPGRGAKLSWHLLYDRLMTYAKLPIAELEMVSEGGTRYWQLRNARRTAQA
jgi:hypothetical protein